MWSLPRFRAICAFASKERQRPKTRSHPPGDAARPRSPWTHHEVGSFRTKGAEGPRMPETTRHTCRPSGVSGRTKLRPVSVRWMGARTRTSPMTGVRPVAASPGSESRIDAISTLGSSPQSPPCRRTISPGMTGADHQTTAGGERLAWDRLHIAIPSASAMMATARPDLLQGSLYIAFPPTPYRVSALVADVKITGKTAIRQRGARFRLSGKWAMASDGRRGVAEARRKANGCLLAGKVEHRVSHLALEARVIHILLGQLGVVLHHGGHHPQQRLVMLDGGVLAIRVLLRVAEGDVCHSGRNGFDDELPHSVGVFPLNVAEEIVECLENVRQPVQLRISAASSSGSRIFCIA